VKIPFVVRNPNAAVGLRFGIVISARHGLNVLAGDATGASNGDSEQERPRLILAQRVGHAALGPEIASQGPPGALIPGKFPQEIGNLETLSLHDGAQRPLNQRVTVDVSVGTFEGSTRHRFKARKTSSKIGLEARPPLDRPGESDRSFQTHERHQLSRTEIAQTEWSDGLFAGRCLKRNPAGRCPQRVLPAAGFVQRSYSDLEPERSLNFLLPQLSVSSICPTYACSISTDATTAQLPQVADSMLG
jgi:hypothetical protein